MVAAASTSATTADKKTASELVMKLADNLVKECGPEELNKLRVALGKRETEISAQVQAHKLAQAKADEEEKKKQHEAKAAAMKSSANWKEFVELWKGIQKERDKPHYDERKITYKATFTIDASVAHMSEETDYSLLHMITTSVPLKLNNGDTRFMTIGDRAVKLTELVDSDGNHAPSYVKNLLQFEMNKSAKEACHTLGIFFPGEAKTEAAWIKKVNRLKVLYAKLVTENSKDFPSSYSNSPTALAASFIKNTLKNDNLLEI